MSRRTGFQQRVYVISGDPADIAAITDDEIAAATEITSSLPAPVNFAGTTESIDTSDISDRQNKSILGVFDPGTIEFETYRDSDTADEQAFQALADETEYTLVKFEGGSIAGSDPAAGDTYDAAPITVGTKADVDSGRNESRRANVPCFVRGSIVRDQTLAASS